MTSFENTRRFCQNCLNYHTDLQGCVRSSAVQVLPRFEGSPAEYEIATRGTPVAGRLDDAMDGVIHVRHGMAEYRVTYSMGVPVRVALFAQPPSLDW